MSPSDLEHPHDLENPERQPLPVSHGESSRKLRWVHASGRQMTVRIRTAAMATPDSDQEHVICQIEAVDNDNT